MRYVIAMSVLMGLLACRLRRGKGTCRQQKGVSHVVGIENRNRENQTARGLGPQSCRAHQNADW